MSSRSIVLALVAPSLLLVACGGATPAPVTPGNTTPTATAQPTTPPDNGTKNAVVSPPIAVRPDLRPDAAWVSPSKAPDWDAWDKTASIAPKAPATCKTKPRAKTKKPPPVCTNAQELSKELETAFADASRDDAIADLERLETCPAAPAGFIRALRAELSPLACGDTLTDPLLKTHPTNIEPAVQHQLVGISLASKLSRTAARRPEIKGATDKKNVLAYIQGPFKTWFVSEGATIEALSNVAAHAERSCGQGIAAVQAGVADMRFVDVARKAPIPDDWKKDRAVSGAYYAALDEALEPRKARGRDAALVGLDILAQCGYVQDTRVDEARNLIEAMYAGKRVVALAGIVFPPRTLAKPNPLLVALPAFYADRLVGTPDASALATWSVHGMPPAARASMEGRVANVDVDTKVLYARARLVSGIAHVRGIDFDRAVNATWGAGPDAMFEGALALVLRKGPATAAELMRVASPGALKWRDTQELDDLAAQDRPDAPYAEYDAAYLAYVAPPDGADAAYFQKLAAKFDHVAQRTQDPALKALAEKRSREMQETAKSAH